MGQLEAPRGLGLVEEYERLRQLTDAPVKVPVPGPFTLAGCLSGGDVYRDRNEITEALLPLINREMKRLVKHGVEFIQLDFLDEAAPGRLMELLGGQADIVMSDMAANTTGHKKTDHLRIMGLAEAAAYFAREVLAPGGAFLAKVFQGGTEGQLLSDLKRDFAVVRHVKPAASRADSSSSSRLR